MQAKSKELIIGLVNRLLSHLMPVFLLQKSWIQKLKFSVQMLWKNISKSKQINRDNQNQLFPLKILVKNNLKFKKILAKAQINILMMISILFQEARVKWWIFQKLWNHNKFNHQVLISNKNKVWFHQRYKLNM